MMNLSTTEEAILYTEINNPFSGPRTTTYEPLESFGYLWLTDREGKYIMCNNTSPDRTQDIPLEVIISSLGTEPA
ncbi:hypothetical protein [Okeania sp. KiyG1]|uniref:hypothetical protein n=1 Tax=Okeania sp. KiyG1 TaxID=2720165 RepID=UPI001924CC0D|nr:hypothetical protein [Okeania sp. KiyG1]